MKLIKKSKGLQVPSKKGEEIINEMAEITKNINELQDRLKALKNEYKEQMIENECSELEHNHTHIKLRKSYERTRKNPDYKAMMHDDVYNKYVKEEKIQIDSTIIIEIH